MAVRRIVESDISGEPGATTVLYGIADAWYEIDLTPEEQEEFLKRFEEYIGKSRKASIKEGTARRRVPKTTAEERVKIRAWARSQGYEVSELGQISHEIQSAYDKAHGINRPF